MNTLHFCRDGILRRTMRTCTDDGENWTTSSLPLQAWEASVDKNIFLKSLHDRVELEDGLTIGELFTNLEPWSDTMTCVACMDFPAFLSEARTDIKPDEELSEIVLEYMACISAVPDYDRNDMEEIRDGDFEKSEFFEFMGKPIKTGRLDMESCWIKSAMLHPEHRDKYEGAESISLTYQEVNKWQHLPVTLKSTANLYDQTASSGDTAIFLGTGHSLTQAEHPNVEVILSPKGIVTGHRISIDPPEPTFFDAIVSGLLWDIGWDYSPTQRNRNRDQCLESVKELEHRRNADEISKEDPEKTEKNDMMDHDQDISREEQMEHRAKRQILKRIKIKASNMGLYLAPDKQDTMPTRQDTLSTRQDTMPTRQVADTPAESF